MALSKSHLPPATTGLTQEAMEGRPTWTDCDEAGDYVVSNVLSPRDLVSRPDNMDETLPHTPFSCKTCPYVLKTENLSSKQSVVL